MLKEHKMSTALDRAETLGVSNNLIREAISSNDPLQQLMATIDILTALAKRDTVDPEVKRQQQSLAELVKDEGYDLVDTLEDKLSRLRLLEKQKINGPRPYRRKAQLAKATPP